MKQFLIIISAMLAMAMQSQAMPFKQAQREALFLTDKMAYELNLSPAQYDAAYEINLDYLMGVTGRHDVYGLCWQRRITDLEYILFDWQMTALRATSYFFRPLFWDAGCWHFGVYAHYPHRTHFYFERPTVFRTYRGGHAWHHNGGRSFYEHNRPHTTHHDRAGHIGMREMRGKSGHSGNSGSFGRPEMGNRSSTRVTVDRHPSSVRQSSPSVRQGGSSVRQSAPSAPTRGSQGGGEGRSRGRH